MCFCLDAVACGVVCCGFRYRDAKDLAHRAKGIKIYLA
jgi:hypothetical protein